METIYFTGFSGVGKSMIGKMLASRKDLEYLDIDDRVEKKENKSIADIFKENGEEYFRSAENYVLSHEVKQGSIVSLGGGIIQSIDNRHLIKSTGRVIYLRAKASTIYKNLKDEYKSRPLLKNDYSIFTIEKLLDERRPYYEELANFIIDIDDKKVDDVFKEALAIYNLACKVKCHIYIK